jgi:hypothetical protein
MPENIAKINITTNSSIKEKPWLFFLGAFIDVAKDLLLYRPRKKNHRPLTLAKSLFNDCTLFNGGRIAVDIEEKESPVASDPMH